MSENTIFENASQPRPAGSVPSPSSGTPIPNLNPQPLEKPIAPTPSALGGLPSVAPQTPPLISSPPGEEKSHGFAPLSLWMFIRAGVGLIILIIVGVIFFNFILPLFGSKNEKVTLIYWGLWEDPRVMQTIIDDFHKQNPSITIKYSREDIKQYRQRLLTRIKNGNGPDIFRYHNSWLPQVSGVLAPLPTDTISTENFKKWYFPVMVQDLTRSGALYGIPLQIDTLALFTNTEMLDAASLKPPETWEDFGKDARILTVKDEDGKIKTAGAALGTYDNITHAPDILSLLFIQNGADIKQLDQTARAGTDTLHYYSEFAKGDSNVWDETLDPSILAFTNGKLGMYFGYSWDIFLIHSANPTLKFQVSPVPHLPGRNMTIASYWVEGVSQKSKHQKEAMLFMKYLTRKETLQKMYSEASKTREFGELYPRADLAESLKDNQLLYPFVNQGLDATSSFFSSDTYDDGLNERLNKYLGDAVRSILGDTSPESALKTLSQGISQVLKDYGQ